jgi:hypothetical protein
LKGEKMRKLIFLLALFLFIPSFSYAEPQDIRFFWDYDNDSFDAVAGFNLYMKDPDASEYPQTPFMTITKENACQNGKTECCLLSTVDGQHLFVITAYNAHAESGYSNEVEYIPYILPPPDSFKIKFTWEIDGSPK